ncbi:MAG: hypothetical protein ACI8XX_000647 [Polaribacter sp.]|jgi:uncharacterized protein involved in exopolysaccharide biosynthesis
MTTQKLTGMQVGETQFVEYQLLLKYMHQLLRYKYRIATLAIVGAGIVFGLSWLIDDRFSAEATIAINISEAPGGVQPKNYRGANTIGAIEYDFIIDGSQSNERDRHLARMESFGFISWFITQQNLLPWLYARDWDEGNKKWKEGTEPDMREAVKALKTKTLYISIDKKTDLINIRMTAGLPDRAAYLANEFVQAFNLYVRNLEAEELKNRRLYLERRLTEVSNTEIHRSIYRLLEAQLAVESLINARANYPLEMIQPATEPLFESHPNRKKWTAFALIGLVFIGIAGVFTIALVSGLRRDLKAYADKFDPKPAPEFEGPQRQEWIDK